MGLESPRRAQVHLHERPEAARQRTLDRNLTGAEKRHTDPAHLARGKGGEYRPKILSYCKDHAHDFVELEAVPLHDLSEQLARRISDLLRGVFFD